MDSRNKERDVQQLLFDSAVEIAVRDGTDNDVFRRLLSELQQQSKGGGAGKPLRKFAPSEFNFPVQSDIGTKMGG